MIGLVETEGRVAVMTGSSFLRVSDFFEALHSPNFVNFNLSLLFHKHYASLLFLLTVHECDDLCDKHFVGGN